MNFRSKETSHLKLDLFKNKLVSVHNPSLDADVKLPLVVELTSEASMYSYQDEYLLDYSPQTLGYYWINNNKCLRTSKGLVFKTTESKKEAVQSTLTSDKKIIHQVIDWQQSTRPLDEKEYFFIESETVKGILYKTESNEWYITIGDRKVIILKDGLEFSF